MASKDGIDVTELAHLANPIWGDPVHRRCIAASLVNVVYLSETNINQAKQLCCLLQFDVKEYIRDDHDGSIFGAVFQWHGRLKAGPGGPPAEVVAFRGTLLRPRNILEDLVLDLKVAVGHYDSISRVKKGSEYLRTSLLKNGSQNIWLAGHSLGAAIALGATRKLEREERHKVEAHLFNPPFISPTLPQLKVVEKSGDLSALTMGLRDDNKLFELYSEFLAVSDWIPNMYVNEKDPICQTYIHYFQVLKDIYRQKRHLLYGSMKYLFSFDLGKKRTPWHIVPSAKVYVATRHLFQNHHALRQWWLMDLHVKRIEYVSPGEMTP